MKSEADKRIMTLMTPAANPMPRAADVDSPIGCAEFDVYSDDVVGMDEVDEWIDVDMVNNVLSEGASGDNSDQAVDVCRQ